MIRKSVEWCMVLSQIGKLFGQGDTLLKKLVSAPDGVYNKMFGAEGKLLGVSRKIHTTQLLKIQHWERSAITTTTELDIVPVS